MCGVLGLLRGNIGEFIYSIGLLLGFFVLFLCVLRVERHFSVSFRVLEVFRGRRRGRGVLDLECLVSLIEIIVYFPRIFAYLDQHYLLSSLVFLGIVRIF